MAWRVCEGRPEEVESRRKTYTCAGGSLDAELKEEEWRCGSAVKAGRLSSLERTFLNRVLDQDALWEPDRAVLGVVGVLGEESVPVEYKDIPQRAQTMWA